MGQQTFRASNVMAALEEVQRKLGPEAIVISVRQVPPGPVWQVWRSPEVEVIAVSPASGGLKPSDGVNVSATIEKPAAEKLPPSQKTSVAKPAGDPIQADQPPAPKRKSKAPPAPKSPREAEAVAAAITAAIRPALDVLPRVESPANSRTVVAEVTLPIVPVPEEVPAFPKAEVVTGLPVALTKMRDRLLSQGVDEGLVTKLITTCMETLSPKTLKDENRLRDYLRQQLQALLRARVPGSVATTRITCLIGLSGAGKTNTCAKLAAYHSRELGQKVSWVCSDTVRSGAISEARVYTDAMGIPLYLAYTPDELIVAVAEASVDADTVLVDTPGCNPFKETSLIELGDYLTVLPNRITYLVAPATSKDSDLIRAMSTFSAFNLKGLIVTRLDETCSYGNVFNLAWRSQLPLAFFSVGRRVPDDLLPAQPGQLVSALFGEGWAK